ncbi:S8 family serine peptidase [bacterium]|nr:S8 family serine peptidase [bacterium]
MNRFQRLCLLCLLAALVPAVSTARAQKIEDELEAVLQTAPPDSELTVLVRPSLAVDVLGLENQLRAGRASRAERHGRMLRALKQKSEASQATLLGHLSQTKRKAGPIREYQSFWITNLVVVHATPEGVRQLASRADVGQVLASRKVSLEEKKKEVSTTVQADASLAASSAVSLSAAKSFNWALTRLKVRELWKRGITGRGMLVGIIDSGVDGNHPALKNKWRGANGATSVESWYDPVTGSTFPIDDLGITHGTGVMGCILGQDGADTLGMAPDAQWIAAKAFDSNGSPTNERILSSFQWMADPDSDPATIDDVPDILNLSFADDDTHGCEQWMWEPIRNLTALGVTVFIATGNVGARVGSPGSNPEFFAIGPIDSLDQRPYYALIGPSLCDGKTIKPDVMAPGHQVLTTRGSVGGGGYTTMNGSSFASPLVAGLGALLRQYNPELTPGEVTAAIRNSADDDTHTAGPDNYYGYGIVNAPAALGKLTVPLKPSFAILALNVSAGGDSRIDPGEQASLWLTVINNGAAASSVSASLLSSSPDVSFTSATASFGAMTTGQSRDNQSQPFGLAFGVHIPRGVLRTFKLVLTAGAVRDTVSFALAVGGEPEPPLNSFLAHNLNRAGLSITNYGVIGTDGDKGGGFVYPDGTSQSRDQLFQGALMLATGPTTISDASYNENSMGANSVKFNHDFSVVPGGNLVKAQPGQYADQEISGVYNDSLAAVPLRIEVSQYSYAWSDAADRDYVIVEYNLTQTKGSGVDGLYVAQHMDWDVGGSGDNDLAGFDRAASLAYMYDSTSGAWVGHALLTQAVAGYRALNFARDIQDGFSTAEKFASMTTGGERDSLSGPKGDWSELLSAGPLFLKPGRTVPVAWAVIGGASLEELRTRAAAARVRYAQVAAQKGIDLAPPVISSLVPPDPTAGLETHTVRARIEDGSDIEQAVVLWRVAGGATFFKSSFGQTDSAGLRAAGIPGMVAGTTVEYYLRAVDAMGNQGFLPAGAPSQVFSFTVSDSHPPEISLASASADTTAGAQRYWLQATVKDDNLARVLAVCAVGDSLFNDSLALKRLGQSDTFRGELTGLERGTTVRYFILAQDLGGNVSFDPPQAPALYLSFRFTPPSPGDGDLDGKLSIFDLLTLLRVLGHSDTPSPEQKYALDLDRNGRIDIFDLLALLHLLAGSG